MPDSVPSQLIRDKMYLGRLSITDRHRYSVSAPETPEQLIRENDSRVCMHPYINLSDGNDRRKPGPSNLLNMALHQNQASQDVREVAMGLPVLLPSLRK